MTAKTNDDLPEGWLSCSLGDVVDYGKTSKAEPFEIEESAWILELEDIEKDTSKLLQRRTFAERKSKSTKNQFDVGDVLYGKLRPYLNKIIIADQPGYCTTEIIPLKSNAALDGRYLFYWLKNPVFLDYVGGVSHGLNMPRLGTDAGKAAPFVLAPIAEQKRIADKLEAVLGRVDACRTRLDRVPEILKRFRQSVLAAATSGRLSTEWREANFDAEVSDTLRQRVPKADDHCNLPASWLACRVGDVMKLKNGFAFKSGDYSDEGIPLVRISNIQDGAVTLETCAKIPAGKANWNFVVEKGDLLVAMSGATTGKFGTYNGAERCLQNQRVGNFKIRDASEVCPGFRNIALQALKHRIEEDAYGGAQPNISPTKIDALPFPCPPLPEQKEIARRVEALFAFADRIEARLAEALAHVERLTPATLAKAFRGELVPQDPNDEPASALLERLRAERTLSVTTPKLRNPRAPRRPRAPKTNAAMTKSRFDEDVKGQPYLAGLLRNSGKTLTAEDLFRCSDLPLVDFYKQLAWEVDQGFIRDHRTKLEAA